MGFDNLQNPLSAAELLAIIRPYPNNAKKHPEKQIAQLAAIVREVGWRQPILVNQSGVIIVGHGRWETWKANQSDLPLVWIIDDKGKTLAGAADPRPMTVDQEKTYRLADNRLNESEWDLKMVMEEIKGLDIKLVELSGFDLDMLGNVDIVTDPEKEWDGMPEYKNEDQTAYRQILVSFKDEDDVQSFAGMIGQSVTDKTRFLWYPAAEIGHFVDKSYEG